MSASDASNDDRGRMESVKRLAQSGADGVPALVALLNDPSWVLRRAVVAALARIGTPAVDALVRITEDRRSSETQLAAAVEALVASSGDVERVLLARVRSSGLSAPALCDFAQIFGRRKSAQALERLVEWSTHADDNIAVAAIEALGRIGGPVVIAPLVDVVERRYFFRTFPAIALLGHSGDPRAIAPLVALVSDPLYAVEALGALGALGLPAAAQPLARALTNDDDLLVRSAARALVTLSERDASSLEAASSATQSVGADAARALSRALPHADEAHRMAIARVLGWTRAPAATSALLSLVVGPEGPALEAARSLASLGTELDDSLRDALLHGASANRRVLLPLLGPKRAATQQLVACLSDADATVRAQAAEWLGRRGDSSVVSHLFALIGDSNAQVAQTAIAAIQSLGSDETKALALAAARSPHLPTRRAALKILAYFAYPEALDVLVEAIDEEDGRLRDAAATGLALLEDPRALEALVAMSKRDVPGARATAMRALGTGILSPEVASVLQRGLGDADAWVRYYACQALGKLHASPISDAMVALLNDPAGQVRVAAIEAIARIGGSVAFALLERASRATDPDVRRASLLGLGTLRRPEAISILLEATRAEDPVTRLVSLSALGDANTPEVVSAILRAGLDEDDRVRAATYGLMASRSAPQIVSWLIERLASESTRERAIAALASQAEGRIEALLAALHDASDAVAPHVVAVLVAIGTSASGAALEAALTLPNTAARRAAARALARLATPRALEALELARSDADAEVRRIASAL